MENQEKRTDTTYNNEMTNIKMPKNLRQIGNTSASSKVIYVEDYVMSFTKQIAEKENNGCTIVILLGHYIRTESSKNIFVKGAIEMEKFDGSNGIILSDEGWTSVYENIKKYFLDVEIVGWALIGTEFFLEGGDNLRKIHNDNFSGTDKILMKVNTLEREENFYRFEQTSFVKQEGYYIYYERNEEMQNYMVDIGNKISEEVNYKDTTTSRIRELISDKKSSKTPKIIKEKDAVIDNINQKSFLERFAPRERNDNKEGRDVTRLLYVASTLMLLVVLIIGGTLIENNKQMNNLENVLSEITDSLNNKNQVVENGDETKVVDGSNVSNESKDPDHVTEPIGTKIPDDASVADTDIEDTKVVEDTDVSINNVEDEDVTLEDDSMDVETISSGIVVDNDDTTTNSSIIGNVVEDIIKDNVEKEPEEAKPTKVPEEVKPTKVPEKVVDEEKEIKYYTVKEGESLLGISLKLYKSANYISEIKKLNNIENEDKIFVGQKLIVP